MRPITATATPTPMPAFAPEERPEAEVSAIAELVGVCEAEAAAGTALDVAGAEVALEVAA